jgi:C4-dicarboxylate-specific signal transduction histidine kinase
MPEIATCGGPRQGRPWVDDIGGGILPEMRVHIDEPFPPKPAGKAMGLGLSSAYSSVQTRGDGLSVEALQGGRTRISMQTPLDSMRRDER